MKKLYLLRLQNVPIFQQLQLEEALLRCDERNWCIINDGSPPAIVMGISGKPEQLIDAKKMAEHPVPLIRRFSGGGTVFIDESTYFVSWICNSDDWKVNCCPQKIGLWTEEIYRLAWPELNIHFKENDYVIDDKKFGGNAQYLRKGRWLHHSSFLWDYKPSNMDYLQIPPKMPQYRHSRSHTDFLCCLKEKISREEMEEKLLNTLEKLYCVIIKNQDCAQKMAEFTHRQATSRIDLNEARINF